MLKVGSIMTRKVVTVPPECSVERALELLRKGKQRHVLVVDGARLVGVLSERDLMERPVARRRLATAGAEPPTQARDRMSASVETVTPEESVLEACRRLVDRRVGCLPVVRDGRLAGVVSEADFLRLYVRIRRCDGLDTAADPAVGTVMNREVTVVSPSESVGAAFELCRAKGIRHLPVVLDGWLMGIASDRDLLPVVGRGEGVLRKVAEVMSPDYVAIAPEAPLSVAAERMLENGFHALPVFACGALKGIVTSIDVLQGLCTLDPAALESAWTGEQALAASRAEE